MTFISDIVDNSTYIETFNIKSGYIDLSDILYDEFEFMFNNSNIINAIYNNTPRKMWEVSRKNKNIKGKFTHIFMPHIEMIIK